MPLTCIFHHTEGRAGRGRKSSSGERRMGGDRGTEGERITEERKGSKGSGAVGEKGRTAEK